MILKLIDALALIFIEALPRGLVQSPHGKINVIMTLGGGSWSMMFTTALLADFSFSCDYAFLWLNKSRYTSSSVKFKLHFSDSCVQHYVAKSVHIATGKQEAAKEAQVCNESMKT